MDRIIRVGIPCGSRLYEAKALSGIRYIHRRNRDLRIERVRLDESGYMFECIENGEVDLIITEYEKLKEYSGQSQNILTIGLIFPQGDTRDVLVTLKKAHNKFDRAVVECHSKEAISYVENTFDNVSCRDSHSNDKLQLERVVSKKCDAAVLSADNVRVLRIDKNRGLSYTFFKNQYDRTNTKAVWVAAIRSDDVQLANLLMPMSDESTLRKLAK
jgi:porphobilinogen deaminase